jgi:hypothetical protein
MPNEGSLKVLLVWDAAAAPAAGSLLNAEVMIIRG